MLDQQILDTLKEYAKKLTKNVQFKLYAGDHEKRTELTEMLSDIASVSEKLELTHAKTEAPVREGLTFELLANGEKSGILFSGIPGGHEFNSLILAMLQVGGVPSKLDELTQKRIQAISQKIHFETIISLDCHICPDVVQTLNQIAMLNPNISNEMIDGSVHLRYMEERNVQGVPTVYMNKKPFSSGQITTDQILEKLTEYFDLGPIETKLDESIRDVLVIGGGPAAASAAIYTARKGLSVTMVAEKMGGQVGDTQAIENLIGTAQTTGPDLVKNLYTHIQEYPIEVKQQIRVKSVDVSDPSIKKVTLSSGEILQTKSIIVATGAKWRELGVPGEKENIGSGVAYCPHCDGPFFKDKKVVVVGGGNSGVEAALDLSGIASSVTVIEFLEELKADQVLIQKMDETANIDVLKYTQTKSIQAESGKVTGIELLDRATDKLKTLTIDGVFVQIGLVPNSEFVKETVETTRFGEIVVDEKCQTNIDGIFACGDVTTVPYKQIIISMGEGAKAGLSAFEYLLRS